MQIIKKIALVFLMVMLVGVVVISFRFYKLGVESQTATVPGLKSGLLSECPPTPNCANSEYPADYSRYIEPIKVTGISDQLSMDRLMQVVQAMGGTVGERRADYLAATFTSTLFQFVDDFELRVDREAGVIHLRSASRVGHGDLGVNQERTLEFKKQLGQAIALPQ